METKYRKEEFLKLEHISKSHTLEVLLFLTSTKLNLGEIDLNILVVSFTSLVEAT